MATLWDTAKLITRWAERVVAQRVFYLSWVGGGQEEMDFNLALRDGKQADGRR